MRKNKKSIFKSLGAVAAFGTLALANRCIEKLEKQKDPEPIDEEKIQKQLTVLSIVYHAIGIFYNE